MLNIAGLRLPMLADRVITGDVYFLNNTATNTNDVPGNGKDPRKPFATLDYALSKMTAGQGDYLIAGPGHIESVTQSLDVAGIHIMGAVCGGLTPTFSGSTAADCISFDADDIEFNGFRFGAPDIDLVTSNMNIAADSAVVKNIYAADCSGTTNYNVVDAITITADGDNCLLENILLFNKTAAVNSFLHLEGAASNVTVRNFKAFGDVGVGGIIDTAKIDYLVLDKVTVCVVGAYPAASLGSNPEGMATDCYFGAGGGPTSAAGALGNLMRIFNVFVTNDVDGTTQGYRLPAFDAAS